MRLYNPFGGLKFDDHLTIYHKISKITSNQSRLIIDFNGLLVGNLKPHPLQFDQECIFVNSLEKTITQGSVDPEKSSNYLTRESFVLEILHRDMCIAPSRGKINIY